MEAIGENVEGLVRGVWSKFSSWRRSAALTDVRIPLTIPPEALQDIGCRFKEQSGSPGNASARLGDLEEERLAARLLQETDIWNLNNVTRTQAYWNVYAEFPELHWALLAHLVSRNGGWSMTDLKGEWLPALLSPDEAQACFEMLETCNALIFRDAYPQLKLYAESRRSGTPRFHLLPRLGVSVFMEPFWQRFWSVQEPALLTAALIVNEQHVIQRPVVESPHFRPVFDPAAFRALPLMQTNQIVFPLHLDSGDRDRLPPLAGRVLENFRDLDERIGFGQCLYAMLFGYPKVRAGAEAFAAKVPHTGSRADYWPGRFRTSANKTGGDSPIGEPAAGGRWYSPRLETAWPDWPLPEAPGTEWYSEASVLSYVSVPKPPHIIEMTDEFLFGQRKWQAAALLNGSLSH
jgi:hypothetical protein